MGLIQPYITLPKSTYFGGKGGAGVVHNIINQLPQHDVFISGFLGQCAVMRYKSPAYTNIGIDIDKEVINDWHDAVTSPEWGSNSLNIIQGNFLRWLHGGGMLTDKNALLYLDPPYLHETRSGHNRYKYEMQPGDHEQLLTRICDVSCMVAISCYDHPIYQLYLKDWRKVQFNAQTRGGVRVETLYMNYDEPMPWNLHDTRFIGRDFRVREKSKRRVETIMRKIERLTPEERAILDRKMIEISDAGHGARILNI
ncbi:MAG: DNA adenine methylase [Saprospiraceae bacterium]|nr:DNA adenine methylase [Saprospiraceae bacterium]